VGVGEQSEQLGAGELGAGFVLRVPANDLQPVLGGEGLDLGAGALASCSSVLARR
jgi:hypothetical protein